jgi:hypothetical protein
MPLLDDLFGTLGRRLQPEKVAGLIVGGMADRLSPAEKRLLARASRPGWWASSMPQDFWKPAGMERQVRVAATLIPAVTTPADPSRPEIVLDYVGRLGKTLGGKPDNLDFKRDRLNREARRAAGLGEMSKRQYNKRFRLLARMERKARKLGREWTKAELLQVAKSRLACRLTVEDLGGDLDTAAFVAYLTATLNRRSVFTAGPQERAYDEVADMLLGRVKASLAAGWWGVAHVLPDADVVARLTEEQKGRLLGLWHAALVAAAGILRQVDAACPVNRQTMVVGRGNDSSCRRGHRPLRHPATPVRVPASGRGPRASGCSRLRGPGGTGPGRHGGGLPGRGASSSACAGCSPLRGGPPEDDPVGGPCGAGGPGAVPGRGGGRGPALASQHRPGPRRR